MLVDRMRAATAGTTEASSKAGDGFPTTVAKLRRSCHLVVVDSAVGGSRAERPVGRTKQGARAENADQAGAGTGRQGTNPLTLPPRGDGEREGGRDPTSRLVQPPLSRRTL